MVLHLMCHYLNQLGIEAYLVPDPFPGRGCLTSGHLHTPVLTAEMGNAHLAAGRRPIAVYAENCLHNNFICDRVIRYLMNRPGERWEASRAAAEQFWRHSDRKSEYILHFAEEFQLEGIPSRPLFVPLVNETIFRAPATEDRQGFLVYSHRISVRDEMIPDWARPFTMVEMSNPRGPVELAALYQTSLGLIVFERTGAQLDALMCGCPVVGIPNQHFTELPMFGRFGNVGVGWGDGVEQLKWAKGTVEIFRRIYRAYMNAFPHELMARIEEALVFFGDT
jgi:hypothetical protein